MFAVLVCVNSYDLTALTKSSGPSAFLSSLSAVDSQDATEAMNEEAHVTHANGESSIESASIRRFAPKSPVVASL